MRTNVITHPISTLLLAAGLLCVGSLGNALASENDPNPPAQSSMKPPVGDTETISTESRSATMDQDKEISLKMKPETAMSSPELVTSTHESPEALSQSMLDLVESQNEKAALGF